MRPVGFADDEALLPVTLRSFQGYRLLQEYFAFPQRYRFFELERAAARRAARATTAELEIVMLFGRGESRPSRASSTPRTSRCSARRPSTCFRKRADRIQVTDGAYEYHVVADRTRPMDFEIYEVTDVAGHGTGADSEQRFLPFYAAYATDEDATSNRPISRRGVSRA